MDKKMKKVTQKIQKAEKLLKKSEKENMKLTKIDKNVRDPLIDKCKKDMKKKKK